MTPHAWERREHGKTLASTIDPGNPEPPYRNESLPHWSFTCDRCGEVIIAISEDYRPESDVEVTDCDKSVVRLIHSE